MHCDLTLAKTAPYCIRHNEQKMFVPKLGQRTPCLLSQKRLVCGNLPVYIILYSVITCCLLFGVHGNMVETWSMISLL